MKVRNEHTVDARLDVNESVGGRQELNT
jgi:hypothetical protein